MCTILWAPEIDNETFILSTVVVQVLGIYFHYKSRNRQEDRNQIAKRPKSNKTDNNKFWKLRITIDSVLCLLNILNWGLIPLNLQQPHSPRSDGPGLSFSFCSLKCHACGFLTGLHARIWQFCLGIHLLFLLQKAPSHECRHGLTAPVGIALVGVCSTQNV